MQGLQYQETLREVCVYAWVYIPGTGEHGGNRNSEVFR
jgi:hypothetical protein